jgi:8-oxo-dGDP phosphatase
MAERPFKGKLFSVRVDETPKGRREVVEHPGSVSVVAVDDRGRVALVSQHRDAVGASLLEIPAGLRDQEGEDPAETARRELREECGLDAGDLQRLGSFYTSPGFTDERQEMYLATRLREADQAEADVDVDEVSWMPLEEAVARVVGGEIADLKTAAGILLAARIGA